MKQVGVEAKKRKRDKSCTVGKFDISSASVESHSFTGENLVSSPAPKRKMPFTEPGAGSASAAAGYVNEADEGEPVPSPMEAPSSRPSSSQHCRHDNCDILLQILDKIVDSITTSQAVQQEKLNNEPARAIDLLREIPNLTDEQWVQAVEFLGNSTRRKFFISMTQSKRIRYLHMRLKW